MKFKNIIVGLVFSIIATALTLVIGFVAAYYIPLQSNEDITSSSQSRIDLNRTYSMEELNQAEKIMKDKIAKSAQMRKARPASIKYAESRLSGKFLTWIPWVFIPFIFVIKNFRTILFILVLPITITIFQFILPIEFLLCAVSLTLSWFVAQVGRNKLGELRRMK